MQTAVRIVFPRSWKPKMNNSCGGVAANGHCQGLMVGSGERTRDLRYNHGGFMRKMWDFNGLQISK